MSKCPNNHDNPDGARFCGECGIPIMQPAASGGAAGATDRTIGIPAEEWGKGTQRVIGIDLGTSTSVVRVKTYIDGRPAESPEFYRAIKIDGDDTIPTVALWDDDDESYLFGKEAEGRVDYQSGHNLIRNFKMDLLSDNPDTKTKATELVQQFFQFLHDAYVNESEQLTPAQQEYTIVSYPAKWSDDAYDVILGAAKAAGFKNVTGMDEPSAAMNTVLIQKRADLERFAGDTATVLLVDMGAGTTDLVLCQYNIDGGRSTILNAWPKPSHATLFGGREIDVALWDYVDDYLMSSGIKVPEGQRAKFISETKVWKEANVSKWLGKNRTILSCGFVETLFTHLGGNHKPFPALDRDTLETDLADYLDQFPRLVNGLLADTPAVMPSDIDLVVLTGGHSQWYFVKSFINGKAGTDGEAIRLPQIAKDPDRIIQLSRPQETVALGLVYQPLTTHKIKAEQKPDDVLVKVTIPRHQAVDGGVIDLLVDGRTVKTRIPAGIKAGQKLRISGKGRQSLKTGLTGDVVLEMTIDDSEQYESTGSVTNSDTLNKLAHERLVKLLDDNPEDRVKVILKRAAGSGDTLAMNMLGDLAQKNSNTEEMAKWWGNAAATGDVLGYSNMALYELLENDNEPEAVAWLKKGAAKGDPSAMNWLGDIAERHEDMSAARRWWHDAAERGESSAMINLALDVYDEKPNKARSWLHKAAETEHPEAMYLLGEMAYKAGDLDEAKKWFEKAGEFGHSASLNARGHIADKQDSPKEAIRWWRLAADAGSEWAAASLAIDAWQKDDIKHLTQRCAQGGFGMLAVTVMPRAGAQTAKSFLKGLTWGLAAPLINGVSDAFASQDEVKFYLHDHNDGTSASFEIQASTDGAQRAFIIPYGDYALGTMGMSIAFSIDENNLWVLCELTRAGGLAEASLEGTTGVDPLKFLGPISLLDWE